MSSDLSVTSASDMQMDYMTLLVTQLQNQNPLEPMDNNQMASQLAQFSQLQQLESMNTSFTDVLSMTELAYANSLIGKEVSFVADMGAGTSDITSASVNEVYHDVDGQIMLIAGEYAVGLDDIISVSQ